MFTREKKLIALLLSAALVLTMNTGLFAAVGAEDVVSAEAFATTPTTPSEISSMSQTVVSQSFNAAGYTFELSFNSTPLFTGKAVDPGVLNAKLSISGNVKATGLPVTKIKFAKGVNKKAVGKAKFTVVAVDKKAIPAASKKDIKKALKELKKALKTTPPFEMEVKKFSVSYNDIGFDTAKKVSQMPTLSGNKANYVASVVVNKKGTKATVKIWIVNAKGKMKGLKVSKKDFSFSSGKVTFTNNYEGEIIIKDGKATASWNAAK